MNMYIPKLILINLVFLLHFSSLAVNSMYLLILHCKANNNLIFSQFFFIHNEILRYYILAISSKISCFYI